MKFFGIFEKQNNRIYRTRTYLCLSGKSLLLKPEENDIIGTIFMLNPGSSRPKGSDINNPFNNYQFGTYTDLETDKTMNVFIDVLGKLQESENKYLDGIIEIKNLFNYRASSLDNDDWDFVINDTLSRENNLNVNNNDLIGDFIFFAWGTSTLNRREIRNLARDSFNHARKKNKKIIFLSPDNFANSENKLSFYHPLGGKWRLDKKNRFQKGIYQAFNTLTPIVDFE